MQHISSQQHPFYLQQPQKSSDHFELYMNPHQLPSKPNVDQGKKESSKSKKVAPTTISKSILRETDSSVGKKKLKKGVKSMKNRYKSHDEVEEDEDEECDSRVQSEIITIPSARSRSTSPVWRPNNTYVPSSRLGSRFKGNEQNIAELRSSQQSLESSLSLGESSICSGGGSHKGNKREKREGDAMCDVCHRPIHESKQDDYMSIHHHHRHSKCNSGNIMMCDDDTTTVMSHTTM